MNLKGTFKVLWTRQVKADFLCWSRRHGLAEAAVENPSERKHRRREIGFSVQTVWKRMVGSWAALECLSSCELGRFLVDPWIKS